MFPPGIVAGVIEDELAQLDEHLLTVFVNTMRDTDETTGFLHRLQDAQGDEQALKELEKDEELMHLRELLQHERPEADPAVAHRIDCVDAFLDHLMPPQSAERSHTREPHDKKAA